MHHPDEAQWFGQDRLLPPTWSAWTTPTTRTLQLVPSEHVPAGLAILDAPDVDSVEQHNRGDRRAQLLASADLWLFVTSAARYSDQVPGSTCGRRRSARQRSPSSSTAPPGRRPDGLGAPGPDAGEPRAEGPAAVHGPGGGRLRGRAARARAGRRHPRLAGVAGCRSRRPSARRAADARRIGPTLARRSHAVADAVTEQLAAAAALQGGGGVVDEATRQLVESAPVTARC